MKNKKINSNYNYSYDEIRKRCEDAKNALDLAKTNETDIGGLETDLSKKMDKPTSTGSIGQILFRTSLGHDWGNVPNTGTILYRHKIEVTNGIVYAISTNQNKLNITDFTSYNFVSLYLYSNVDASYFQATGVIVGPTFVNVNFYTGTQQEQLRIETFLNDVVTRI